MPKCLEHKASADASHEVEVQLGGKAKRSRALRVTADGPAWADVAGFRPVNTVPKTRAECPDLTKAPCGHWRCRFNLARLDSCDRAGRPSLASVPRDAQGHTLQVGGDLGDERAPTTLEPATWLKWNSIGSLCALEYAERGPQSNEQIADAIGRHRTLTARIVKSAFARFIAAGGTLEGIQALLEQEHGGETRAGWWLDEGEAPRRKDKQA